LGASGYITLEVLAGPEIPGTGLVPVVSPTLTVLAGPYDVREYAFISGTLQNPSVDQTIQGRAQVSWDGLGAWTDIPQLSDLLDINPAEIRPFYIETTPYRWLRLVATASGVGISNVPIRVQRGASVSAFRSPTIR